MDLFDLRGKAAIVTGGNGGLGRGMALGLAAAGANLVIAARDQAKTAETAAELRQAHGVEVLEVQVDVCDEASVHAMVAQTLQAFDRLDILVNNAGTNIRRPPEELSMDDWRTIMDTNLTSTFLCSQAVHDAMVRVGGGKIINNGSMFSIFGGSHVLAYGASKGGVVQFTKSLAGGVGQGQHPGQRHSAGLAVHHVDQSGHPGPAWPARAGAVAQPAGALGRAGGFGGGGGVSG